MNLRVDSGIRQTVTANQSVNTSNTVHGLAWYGGCCQLVGTLWWVIDCTIGLMSDNFPSSTHCSLHQGSELIIIKALFLTLAIVSSIKHQYINHKSVCLSLNQALPMLTYITQISIQTGCHGDCILYWSFQTIFEYKKQYYVFKAGN